MSGLASRVVLITGGSRGIGRAVAEKFLEEGAAIVVAARTASEVRAAAGELGRKGPVLGVVGDVSRRADIARIVRKAERLTGAVDVLVNAAGVQTPIGAFADADMARWKENIDVNLVGTAFCCRAVLPGMIAAGRGRIINFSGGGAMSSRPCFSAYAAAKAGIVRLTEVLADELRASGIRVYAVSPGAVRTRLAEEILATPRERVGSEYERVRAKERTGFDSARAAAELVSFLASPAADGLSGKTISAVWDPWRDWAKGTAAPDGDLYVLRRIDGRQFRKGRP
ncbi:MAG: SDR family oxidoreductase [Candidatus Aminicenantes bacterium]|nr:SDR family oxidoreductase [Candidatus Aminicenantes bacterium]